MSENTWNVITDSLGLLRNAAALVTDANRQAPTPCSDWTVTQVLQHAAGDQLAWAAAVAACALDAAVHAWDIAIALGQPGALSDELAVQLLPAARAIVEPLRQ